MPPPRISRSVSTITVLNSAISVVLLSVGQLIHFRQTERSRLGMKHRRVQITLGFKPAVRHCFAFGRSADRELKPFDHAVAEFHGPEDRIRGTHRRRGSTQW